MLTLIGEVCVGGNGWEQASLPRCQEESSTLVALPMSEPVESSTSWVQIFNAGQEEWPKRRKTLDLDGQRFQRNLRNTSREMKPVRQEESCKTQASEETGELQG
jgi:hypothetical protein